MISHREGTRKAQRCFGHHRSRRFAIAFGKWIRLRQCVWVVWGDFTLACRTDDLVGEIEKLIESEPLAIPDPDASVAERVAEVLKHIVGRFAGLAPRARVRAAV